MSNRLTIKQRIKRFWYLAWHVEYEDDVQQSRGGWGWYVVFLPPAVGIGLWWIFEVLKILRKL